MRGMHLIGVVFKQSRFALWGMVRLMVVASHLTSLLKSREGTFDASSAAAASVAHDSGQRSERASSMHETSQGTANL